mgnify:CR=1 FL=1
MNKDEIKKGLTVCAGDSCDNCSYYKFHNCYDRLKLDARSLIIEQEKKIEKLKAENKQLKTECALLDDELRIARQETIDVLNELKTKLFTIFGKTICSDLDTEDITDIIDELLEEYE